MRGVKRVVRLKVSKWCQRRSSESARCSESRRRRVIRVANAVRTSAVAKGRLALDVVVPYVLVVTLVTVSYVLWSERQLVPAADGMKTGDAVAAAQFIVTE